MRFDWQDWRDWWAKENKKPSPSEWLLERYEIALIHAKGKRERKVRADLHKRGRLARLNKEKKVAPPVHRR